MPHETEFSTFTEAMRRMAAQTAEVGRAYGATAQDVADIINNYRRAKGEGNMDKMQTGRVGDDDVYYEELTFPRLTLRLNIKRVDKSIPLPEYKSSGAVAMDLMARGDHIIRPGEEKLIPLNNIIECPVGYGAFIVPRSSLYKNKGLILTNSIGVVDSDFRGEGDEMMALLKNLSSTPAAIAHGERIVQLFLLKVPRLELNEVEEMSSEDRGGFGSTGSF